MSRRDKSLPILARIVLQRGLAERQQIDEVLAKRLYDPSISLTDALLNLPNVDRKQLNKLIKGFLKEDKRFSSLLLSMGLINQNEYDDAVRHQKQQSERGILVRVSSLLERKGVTIQIGGYRLVECLGSGAMGAVFSARDLERDRPAAVKIVRPDVLDDETTLSRFLREAKTMMNIQHPNVVAYKSSGQDKDIVYIVFELVSGQNLRELLTVKKKLSVPQAVTLMADLFGGLQAIHDAGVIHRDLKPDNVLLSIKGIPKITDFGLARRAGANESLSLTLEGSILGTPHYMSPEQCRGEEATFASDLYAMGALFYHLIAGQPPFPGRNLHVIIENHIHERAPDPRDIGAPKSVAQLILQLMSKNPNKRGESAGEISSYLKDLISQGFTEALGDIEDTTDSKILTNEFDLDDEPDSDEPEAPPKTFVVKGAEPDLPTSSPSRAFQFPKKLCFAGLLLAAIAFGFTFLDNEYPAVGELSKEEMKKFVSQEFRHYNELKSDSKSTSKALGQLRLIQQLSKDKEAEKLLDQRFVRGLKKSLTADQTNFHRQLNRQRKFEPILKQVLPEIDQSFAESNFQSAELRLEALDQVYGSLPEISQGIAAIREREQRMNRLGPWSLESEVEDAINHFRWEYAGLMQGGQFQEAGDLAWKHYLRYGDRKGHGLELLFAFGKACVSGKLKRELFQPADPQALPDELSVRIKTSFFARFGPQGRPQTWAVVAPGLLAVICLSYVFLYCLILGSGRAYTFLRWGLWIRLALGRKQPGRAAAIAEKAGWLAEAGDFYIEANDFAAAAGVFLAGKQDRRAAVAFERGNKYEEASSIYEQIGDLQKAGELQLKAENWDKAGSLFHKAKSLSRAADAYTRGGQIDKAADILRNEGRHAAAAKLLADDYEVLKTKGAPKAKEKLPERALQIAKLFSEANYPADAAVYFHESGHLFEAAEHFAAAEMPREAIELYVEAGEKNLAIDLLHQLGDVRAASLLMAEVYMDQGQFETAAVEFEKAGELVKASKAWEQHGDFHQAAKAAKRAKDEQRAAEMHEMSGDFQRAGEMYEKSGQQLEAIRCYEKAANFMGVAKIRRDLGERVKAAQAWLLAEQPTRALDDLKRISENDADYFDGLALFAKTAGPIQGWQSVKDKLILDLRQHEMDIYSSVAYRALAMVHEKLEEAGDSRQLTHRIQQGGYGNDEDKARMRRLGQQRPRRTGVIKGPRSSRSGPGPRGSATRRPTGTMRPGGPPTGRHRRPTEPGGRRSGVIKHPTARMRATKRRPTNSARLNNSAVSSVNAPQDISNKNSFVGRRIDRYQVSEVLGEGAYAWVLKARHVMLDREVALKVLKPLNNDMQTVKQRFLAEGRVISKLQHPNIVEVYDFGETEDGLLYMALEYLQGQDLRSYLKENPDRSVKYCTEVTLEILKSLQAAHELSIVHRDLKPENVFLVNDGTLRVLDFGIAKVIHETHSTEGQFTTKDGSFLGTPKYCSPEQALGESTGPWTDLYAAALIYFEMLTGKLPFTSQNALGYLTHHASSKPASPKSFREDIPPEVERSILRALNKKPMQRYPSAQSFIRALESVL